MRRAFEDIVSAIATIQVSRSLSFSILATLTVSIIDRVLTHINKKGRPVSQCPHCRGLRKSRAAHTKCECGDKPHVKADCDTRTAGRGKHAIVHIK